MTLEKQINKINIPQSITNIIVSSALGVASLTGCECIRKKTLENLNTIPTNRNQAKQEGMKIVTYTVECIIEEISNNNRCIVIKGKEFCFPINDINNITKTLANKFKSLNGVINVEKDFRNDSVYRIKLTEISKETFSTIDTINKLCKKFNVFMQIDRQSNIITIIK